MEKHDDKMDEITLNLHNHSSFSGGDQKYHTLAQAGLTAGIDVMIITDTNVLVSGKEQYYFRDDKKILLLTGEEIFSAFPNNRGHLLILNGNRDFANHDGSIRGVISQCNRDGAITIIAHPFDGESAHSSESSTPWADWDVANFTGLEILNLQSEYKNQRNLRRGFFGFLDRKPRITTNLQHASLSALAKWDELLCGGKQVVGVCGSVCANVARDNLYEGSPIREPEHLFAAANNHLYVDDTFGKSVENDRDMIYRSLLFGRSYVAIDAFHSTKGFVFKADTERGTVYPGDRVQLDNGATLKIELPVNAVCRLIHQGKIFREWENVRSIPLHINQTGYYRVEVYIPFEYQLRGWIYTNPIYFL